MESVSMGEAKSRFSELISRAMAGERFLIHRRNRMVAVLNSDHCKGGEMVVPIGVKPLENCRLWIKFSDGAEGVVDLSEYAGKGVFALWNDHREFEKVHIGPGGEIAWDDRIDMCPDALYLRLTGKRQQPLHRLPPLE